MTKNNGFTLVELLAFVVILGIVSSIILTTIAFALRYTPVEHNQTVATNTTTKCMEYLLGQRYLNGFKFNNQTCPGSGDDVTVPAFCSNLAPNGFTPAVKISCATVPNFSGEQAFKLIEVKTTGSGTSILKLLIADY